MTEIRVLAVRQPWASLIVEGLKTIEVRSSDSYIRERIAIYSTSHQYSGNKHTDLVFHFNDLRNKKYICWNDRNLCIHSLNTGGRGVIIGTVELVASSQCNDEIEYDIYKNEHLSPSNYYKDFKTFFWHMRRPIKFSSPIPYKPPKGCIVWSKTEIQET